MNLADEILAVLDDPTYMWAHALRESPEAAQRLFLTMPFLPQPVALSTLQSAYSSQNGSIPGAFFDSLQSLDDSFLSITMDTTGGRTIGFRNPSLEDFAHAYLNQHSDWLDALLGAPKFFEQISGIHALAKSQEGTRSEGKKVKYPQILAWLKTHAHDLIPHAVRLVIPAPERTDFFSQRRQAERISQVGEILEIMIECDVTLDAETGVIMRTLAQESIDPNSQAKTDAMVELLSARRNRDALDAILGLNSALTLRTNILGRHDGWKYSFLARLDELLDLEEHSMDAWGDEYSEYASQVVDRLSDSEDDDELYLAIEELEDISRFLGIDLDDKVAALQQRYDELPSDDSGDYNEDDRERAGRSGWIEPTRELDHVFNSLLE